MTESRITAPTVALVALAAWLWFSAPAQSETYKNLDDARRAGDRAASAPAYDQGSRFAYKGRVVDAEFALKHELSCVQDETSILRCENSVKEAQDAALRAVASRQPPRARASECAGGYALLVQYYYAHYGGYTAQLLRTGAWFNNGHPLDNETSSYRMGERSGHMAEGYNGSGWWLPFNTGVCATHSNLNGTGWSDRVSSRYRN